MNLVVSDLHDNGSAVPKVWQVHVFCHLSESEVTAEKTDSSGVGAKSGRAVNRQRAGSMNEAGVDTSSSLTSTASDSCKELHC